MNKSQAIIDLQSIEAELCILDATDSLNIVNRIKELFNRQAVSPEFISIVPEKSDHLANEVLRKSGRVISLNGNRASELPGFFQEITSRAAQEKPWVVYAVTADVEIISCLRELEQYTHVRVMVAGNSPEILAKFKQELDDVTLLSDQLPPPTHKKVMVLVDFENIPRTMQEKYPGIALADVIAALKAAVERAGERVIIFCYGNWHALDKWAGEDVQYALAQQKIHPVYSLTSFSTNSIDMVIADDLHTMQQLRMADELRLVSCDGDFRKVVATLQDWRANVSLVGVKEKTHGHLLSLFEDVVYLDDFLVKKTGKPVETHREYPASEKDREALAFVLLKLETIRRVNEWNQFLYYHNVKAAFADSQMLNAQLEVAICAGYLTKAADNNRLFLNQNEPPIRSIVYLVPWLLARLHHLHEEKHMAYVAGNFLARGMRMGKAATNLAAALDLLPAEKWLALAISVGLVKYDQEHGWSPNISL